MICHSQNEDYTSLQFFFSFSSFFFSNFFLADSKSKQYLCDHCSKDISTQAKIRCAICDELHLCLGIKLFQFFFQIFICLRFTFFYPFLFSYCVGCFSVGAETKSHKYWHDYRIVEYLHVPLFCRQWGADEEILLLEGLEVGCLFL